MGMQTQGVRVTRGWQLRRCLGATGSGAPTVLLAFLPSTVARVHSWRHCSCAPGACPSLKLVPTITLLLAVTPSLVSPAAEPCCQPATRACTCTPLKGHVRSAPSLAAALPAATLALVVSGGRRITQSGTERRA